MTATRSVRTAVGVGVLTLALAACTGEGGPSSGAAPASTACPTDAPPLRDTGGGPATIAPASTVAASDDSTSTVVAPDPAQIRCGRIALKTHRDIGYASPDGSSRALTLDLITPVTAGAKPLVVFLPGGGFRTAINDSALGLRTFVAEFGYVVASIEYRTLADGAIYRDAVVDVKSAVRFLRAHAADYGIDPSQVALWGESAGGYLAAMAGTTNGQRQFDLGDHLDQSSDVQAVVDTSGPANLANTQADFDAATQRAYAGPDNDLARWVHGVNGDRSLADDPAAVAAADPATYADASDPPFLFLHGDDDRIVSPSQTLAVHNALGIAGVDTLRYVVQGAGHGSPPGTGPSLWSSQQVMGYLVDFLDEHLKN